MEKLEYRGYDSAGIAVRDGDKIIEVVKAKGRLKVLEEKTDDGNAIIGTCGIGHTRWATHGEPSETNAHPHTSDDGNVVGVHNGIIENYKELKEKLERKDSPMIIGVNYGECYVASDVPAILKYTRQVYYIGNMEIGRLANGQATFYNLDGDEIAKELVEIKWDAEAAEKGGFEHFMMKEIHEQPKAIEDTLNSVIKEEHIDLSSVGITEEELRNVSQIFIVACGSAYHTGVVTQYVMEDLARVPVRVELASEFRYRKPILNEKDLVIVVSQSGETADTLAALREAKSQGVKTLGIVNVVGSSIAREADYVFYTLAGPEIAVATTKAYSAQLIAGYVLSLAFAKAKEKITEEKCCEYVKELQTLPEKINRIIAEKERIQWFASKQANTQDIFFVGRGIDYAISLEGSLKLKEISYIHSEAYAAGELKHGTISLIEDGTLVIGLLTQDVYMRRQFLIW